VGVKADSLRKELPRRLFHVSGLLLALVPRVFPGKSAAVFLSLALLETLIEILRLKSPVFSRLVGRLFSPLMRPAERRRLSGSFYYLWGVALSFALFPERCALYGLFVLALADPVAGVIHVRSTRRFLRKSLEGTLCFFLLTFVILRAGGWGGETSLAVSLILALLENLSPLDDNFLLPVAASFLLFLFGSRAGL